MSKYQLSKTQALKLLTPVVDGEASEAEKKAFMEFIAQNQEVRRKFQAMQKVKSVVSDRCPREKAPATLRNRVQKFIHEADQQETPPSVEPPIYDIPCKGPGSQLPKLPTPESPPSPFKSKYWLFSSAATMMVVIAIGSWLNIYEPAQEPPVYQVEEKILEHFESYDGQFVEPTITAASIGSAQSRLSSDYNISMQVPEIQNSEFMGVVMDELLPRFRAPMLEYYLESEDQYIYVYALDIEKLDQSPQLTRNTEAFTTLEKADEFHIQKINNKAVVSWKWENTWYTAISHQEGDRLASWVNRPMAHIE